MPVSDYNTDPDLNTTISGINIAEGCAPSGINDAIRQLMADVKEESEAQAEAVAGAESSASEQLTALDSTLRALIAQEVAKYLPLSGGDIVYLNFVDGEQGGGYLYAADKTFFVGARGTDRRDGAFLRLYSLEEPVDPGAFLLGTRNDDGSWGPALFGDRDRVLWWNGSPVLTSAGGRMNGGAYISGQSGLLRGDSDAGDIWISGQPVSGNGSFIQLNGGSRAGNAGYITISPGTPTSRAMVEFSPDGSIYANGSPVLTLVASWRSGTSWYRKYSDGFIEQGGRFAIANDNLDNWVGFHTPFSNNDYTLVFGINSINDHSITWHRGGCYNRSNTGFTTWAYDRYIIKDWYACGY